MIEFKIDGKDVSAPAGSMIIEAADAAGIYIPRFCYHHKLSIVANCRMCLVEVANGRKPVPACATPATQDMQVFTNSPAALESQRVVMQFLLINHPLDCPICDQGGECELQDMSIGFGDGHSEYTEPKRAVASDDIGPLIETEMTRCIHCTRCVRFGEEVAGLRELGINYRGEDSEIGTYVKHFMNSELSGNIIDLCPVGALVAKPSRYRERSWELTERESIAPHDCIGSNIFINSRGQEYAPQRVVNRVNPRNNDAVNECWISDRDRFSYEGLRHTDRVLKPRMKKNGNWVEVDWKYALMAVADRLQAIVHNQSPDQIAAIVSPNSSVEECYLVQKLMRQLGSNNIDHRLRELDFSDQTLTPAFPNLGIKLSDIETQDAILLIGSQVRTEQPMLSNRINKAQQEGATVMAVNPMDYRFTFPVAHQLVDVDIVAKTAEIVKALADSKGKTYATLSSVVASEDAKQIADVLQASDSAFVLLGTLSRQHPQAAELRALVRVMCELSGCRSGVVTDGANSAGAWLSGAVPHRGVGGAVLDKPGLDAKSLLTTDPVRAYLLLNVEPEMDTAYPAAALQALQQAGCVVNMTVFATPQMEAYSDFILPVAPFSETTGTFVNIEGCWQQFPAASVPHGDAKPIWKVMRVLANFLQLEEFDYQSSHQIHDEVKALCREAPDQASSTVDLTFTMTPQKTLCIAMPHMYRVDGLVRRAKALQQCVDAASTAVQVNSRTATGLGVASADAVSVRQGEQAVEANLIINECLADGVIVLPTALEAMSGFSTAFADVTLQAVT
ncbi:MAG: NADH-quinone oxidoreductase subunit G [Coxiella sp. (in: Bacteria)]|nr:MAG: NADH-quinone oxidoreductase subunit G [Coxiella sp. (in: g-proteobacteria)]